MTCGTPDGIRAHQEDGQRLCVVCAAAQTAWLERLAFITPTPREELPAAALGAPAQDVPAQETLREIVTRRRVLKDLDGPPLRGLPSAIEEAS